MIQLVKVAKAADHFNVTGQTVRNWLMAGRIRGIRLPGGEWRVLASELDRILESLDVEFPPPSMPMGDRRE